MKRIIALLILFLFAAACGDNAKKDAEPANSDQNNNNNNNPPDPLTTAKNDAKSTKIKKFEDVHNDVKYSDAKYNALKAPFKTAIDKAKNDVNAATTISDVTNAVVPLKNAKKTFKEGVAVKDANDKIAEADTALTNAGKLGPDAVLTGLINALTIARNELDTAAKNANINISDIKNGITKVDTTLNALKSNATYSGGARGAALKLYTDIADIKTEAKEKLEEAFKALDDLTNDQKAQNGNEVTNAITAIEDEQARRQSLENKKTDTLAAEIKQAQELYDSTDAKYNALKVSFKTAIDKATNDVNAAKDETEVAAALALLDTAKKDFKDGVKEVDELAVAVKKAEAKLAKVEIKLKAAEESISKSSFKADPDKNDPADLNAVIVGVSNAKNELGVAKDTTKTLKAIEDAITKVDDELGKLKIAKDNFDAEETRLTNELAAKTDALSKAKVLVNDEIKKTEKPLEEANKALTDAKTTADKTALNDAITDIKNAVAALEAARDALDATADKLTKAITDAKIDDKLTDLETAKKAFEQQETDILAKKEADRLAAALKLYTDIADIKTEAKEKLEEAFNALDALTNDQKAQNGNEVTNAITAIENEQARRQSLELNKGNALKTEIKQAQELHDDVKYNDSKYDILKAAFKTAIDNATTDVNDAKDETEVADALTLLDTAKKDFENGVTKLAKEEADRLAKEEADRLAKEEADRLAAALKLYTDIADIKTEAKEKLEEAFKALDALTAAQKAQNNDEVTKAMDAIKNEQDRRQSLEVKKTDTLAEIEKAQDLHNSTDAKYAALKVPFQDAITKAATDVNAAKDETEVADALASLDKATTDFKDGVVVKDAKDEIEKATKAVEKAKNIINALTVNSASDKAPVEEAIDSVNDKIANLDRIAIKPLEPIKGEVEKAIAILTNSVNLLKEAQKTFVEEADRLAKEEADRLAKEEADRLAKEEADRLAKEEADRLAKEEADRLAAALKLYTDIADIKTEAKEKLEEAFKALDALTAAQKAQNNDEVTKAMDAIKNEQDRRQSLEVKKTDTLAEIEKAQDLHNSTDAKYAALKVPFQDAITKAATDVNAAKDETEVADALASLDKATTDFKDGVVVKDAKDEIEKATKAVEKAKNIINALTVNSASDKAPVEEAIDSVNDKIANLDRIAIKPLEPIKGEVEKAIAILTNSVNLLKEAQKTFVEEADRLAKEEADRLAKEEADRLAKEEADRLAKEEADRLAKEEADRLAKEEADRLAKEEADRLAKEEADRLAKEEADRLAKEEADRLAKEEADRLAAALKLYTDIADIKTEAKEKLEEAFKALDALTAAQKAQNNDEVTKAMDAIKNEQDRRQSLEVKKTDTLAEIEKAQDLHNSTDAKYAALKVPFQDAITKAATDVNAAKDETEVADALASLDKATTDFKDGVVVKDAKDEIEKATKAVEKAKNIINALTVNSASDKAPVEEAIDSVNDKIANLDRIAIKPLEPIKGEVEKAIAILTNSVNLLKEAQKTFVEEADRLAKEEADRLAALDKFNLIINDPANVNANEAVNNAKDAIKNKPQIARAPVEVAIKETSNAQTEFLKNNTQENKEALIEKTKALTKITKKFIKDQKIAEKKEMERKEANKKLLAKITDIGKLIKKAEETIVEAGFQVKLPDDVKNPDLEPLDVINPALRALKKDQDNIGKDANFKTTQDIYDALNNVDLQKHIDDLTNAIKQLQELVTLKDDKIQAKVENDENAAKKMINKAEELINDNPSIDADALKDAIKEVQKEIEILETEGKDENGKEPAGIVQKIKNIEDSIERLDDRLGELETAMDDFNKAIAPAIDPAKELADTIKLANDKIKVADDIFKKSNKTLIALFKAVDNKFGNKEAKAKKEQITAAIDKLKEKIAAKDLKEIKDALKALNTVITPVLIQN
jgi:chromosome segregation ATPase